jgi:threonine dehydratase
MALSWEARRPVESDRCATIADGLAVRIAVPYAVEALNDAADRMVLVSEREIARGVADLDRAGIRAEAAAGAGLAAVAGIEDVAGPVVLIVTGGNIDDDLLARCRDEPDSFAD